MRKTLFEIMGYCLIIYSLVCWHIYMTQEQLLFFPQKLNKDYQFNFDTNFEEINIKSFDSTILNGLLFKVDSSKGVIFYLHGNAGSLQTWGKVAKTYTDLGYDVFMLDYRGYGKSEGQNKSEKQVFKDVEVAYQTVRKRYAENKIIILGYSIGTGLATKIASEHSPKLLILQAPYYSMVDMMNKNYPILPTFILKYRFETNQYITKCKAPIVIFHGNIDEVIDYNSSINLSSLFKKNDKLIILKEQGHNDITDNQDYQKVLKQIL